MKIQVSRVYSCTMSYWLGRLQMPPKQYIVGLLLLVANQNWIVSSYLLKTSHTLVLGHRQVKLKLSNKALLCWLTQSHKQLCKTPMVSPSYKFCMLWYWSARQCVTTSAIVAILVIVNTDCQLAWIWNHTGDSHLDTTVMDYLS